ncbi:hypothetical protein M501DRAFT_1013086 [Patellaria atrata CBS 101060]|uniref:Uncharacterized protein n=1 Tax=Patellaria atrata CBS 101060 TaxID=1346257 RepID=A0A9P4VVN3_9PEZI|nr:hypothetical protein M501DRAFT_1013086 [Patellaria atrata CBS 101060]
MNTLTPQSPFPLNTTISFELIYPVWPLSPFTNIPTYPTSIIYTWLRSHTCSFCRTNPIPSSNLRYASIIMTPFCSDPFTLPSGPSYTTLPICRSLLTHFSPYATRSLDPTGPAFYLPFRIPDNADNAAALEAALDALTYVYERLQYLGRGVIPVHPFGSDWVLVSLIAVEKPDMLDNFLARVLAKRMFAALDMRDEERLMGLWLGRRWERVFEEEGSLNALPECAPLMDGVVWRDWVVDV